MSRFIIIFITVLTTIATIASAYAEPLTPAKIEKFVSSVEELRKHESDFPKTTATIASGRTMDSLSKMIDSDGNFILYQSMVKNLSSYPEEATQLRGIIKKAGFKDEHEWAKTGDAVILAYGSTQLSAKDRKEMSDGMAEITPEMMAMMPAETQAMMKSAMAASKAMASVPPEDVEAIKPFIARLEAAN